ncbi:hypothetical protein SMICM304S_04219 [Streptomyces microflavus]
MSLTAPPAPAPRITYGAVLGSPYVARLLGGTLIGRLPNGMAPVAILLWATASGSSIAFGGLLSALYGLASALAQPVKGFVMDRHGQGAVHLPAALLNSALLVALPLAGPYGGPGLATALVVGGGLTAPPLEAGLRALWPSVLPDPRLRHAALALDTGTQGLLYIVGPLLVAALSSAYNPAVALAVTAALGLVGTAAVALAAPSRRWRPERSADRGAVPVRRLAAPAVTLLFVSLTGIGFAIGAMNVWSVSMAEHYEQDMLAGVIPAVFSAGSFVGGLIYGRRAWSGTATRRLIVATAAFLGGRPPASRSPCPVRGHRRGRRSRCVPDHRGRLRLRHHRLPRPRGPYNRVVRVADPLDRRRTVRRYRPRRTSCRAAARQRGTPRGRRSFRPRRPSCRAPASEPDRTPAARPSPPPAPGQAQDALITGVNTPPFSLQHR